MNRRRLFVEWVLIGLGASLLVLLALHRGISRPVDNLLYDLLSSGYAAPVDDRIVVVQIDDDALARIGPWPWPRAVHADAIDAMQASGAKAILYDVLFMEPSAQDARLGAAMRGGAGVFLPLLVASPGLNGAQIDVHSPVAPVARAAQGLGTATVRIDDDGQVRRIDLITRAPGRAIPHVVERVYRHMTGRTSAAFARAVRRDAPVLLPIRPSGSFRTIGFGAVVAGEVPDIFFRDKIVLVGASATGLGDMHPVSAGRAGQMPGVEVQANLLNALFADRFVEPLDDPWRSLFAICPLWLLLIAFWTLSPSRNFNLSLLVILLLLGGSAALLTGGGIWVGPASALLGVIIVYPLWGWRRLVAISRFLVSEVDRLTAEPDIPAPPDDDPRAGDRIAVEAQRLQQVITMIRHAAREREEMLQFLSHDMRAPQAAIIALSEDIAGTGTIPPDRVERIRRYARHSLQLADDFVQLARLDGRTRESELLDLGDAMAQAADIIWSLARARGVSVQREEPVTEIWVEGDGASLVRAFTNLLDNAVRHSPPGGHVRYRAIRDGEYALCSVMDNGPGLPPERRANPFERYGATRPPPGDERIGYMGAGLGLAFVKAVVRAHRGTISYRDNDGGGARFDILLKTAVEHS